MVKGGDFGDRHFRYFIERWRRLVLPLCKSSKKSWWRLELCILLYPTLFGYGVTALFTDIVEASAGGYMAMEVFMGKGFEDATGIANAETVWWGCNGIR